ncbi:biosynthetic peptidoglycan transglycosylase [Dietzia natronolimnaea]|uniref:biosynthetic peptidoglycan transglycosylase n=1 Tax=Dietzia natronolimnaea TaxID=161920 RepID=UPI0015F8456A|nr:biosynthetic peptidoglycan transglycosylase [Dietzia natronolimnaea]MBB1037387.1 glycosyltransferase [Dietzia natronolimnaea]
MTAYAYSEGPYDPDNAETEVFYLDYLEEPDKPEPEPETWWERIGVAVGTKLAHAAAEFMNWLDRVVARGRKLLAIVLALILCAGAGTWAWAAGGVRFSTPESTAFMRTNPDPIHQWVGMNHISRHLVATAIVVEDAQIGVREGAVDWEAFADTAQRYLEGDRDIVGGSTIHQQLVKNLYLSEARSPQRKALELLIAVPMARVVPEDRVLELYLNFAQFGPNIYGVCAATWYYFQAPPWYVSRFQAALLIGVLPYPSDALRAKDGGGPYVIKPERNMADFRHRVYERAPAGLAYHGGHEPLMEQVGIVGDASDHEHVGPDSCSTMPEGVRELLEKEGQGA